MTTESLAARYQRAINRLGKWRTVFAGWQLGTRADTDPECQAVRDQFDRTVMLRAEVNALTAILVRSGFLTEAEFMTQVIEECAALERAFEQRFPGFTATDVGMSLDPAVAAKTMAGWRR